MSFRKITRDSVVGFLLVASPALATGAGSSGGGLLLKDSVNPWFLQNTAEVHYCIVENSATFTLDRARTEAQIGKALAYWQGEFKKAPHVHIGNLKPPMDQLIVGTQRFVSGDCTPDTDLIFQLGAATPDQTALIDDFQNTVAETVRTAYDRVNLRGKGFIYVAPDAGEGRPGEVGDGYWSLSDGSLLFVTLVHELGHVFGIPDSGIDGSLMSYDFVERLVSYGPEWAAILGQIPLPETVQATHSWLDFVGCYEISTVTDKDRWQERTLGIPAHTGQSCSSVRYRDNSLQVLAGTDEDHMQLVGAAQLRSSTESGRALISVWLPPEQLVYQYSNPNDAQEFHRFSAVAEQVVHLTGTYQVAATGVRTPVTFTMMPGNNWPPRVAAVVDGELIPDLFAAGGAKTNVRSNAPRLGSPFAAKISSRSP